MRRAALAALLAVALAGCGSSSTTGSAGRATLWVTRDRGAQVLHVASVPAGESVLQALDRLADVKTRFGGRYVRSVDGVSEHGQRAWFYYVNGYLADRGSADYRLHAGDLAWWDYRAWRNPAQDPLVVGAFPQPFLNGYGGKRRKTVVVSSEPARVRAIARRLHASVAASAPDGDENVLVVEQGGPGRARLSFTGSTSPGSPVRLVFRGDPKILLRRWPFRFRYAVG
ncbi:MAG TPA: DUF4430 domain-containing protein [Gaiellaceae bacterium]